MILGVDTHKDVDVAAVITTLGASLAQQECRQPPSAIANYSPGQGRSVLCAGPVSNALAPSEPR
ncbi:hypothetical protein ABZV60_34020 [Streptomyces sp. NPDC004787]|uniref:hypothetical protein n=1 Tax=Streptomyces sp. NPDC004787 TaxID=3154291 RepID=UPI0033A1DFEF